MKNDAEKRRLFDEAFVEIELASTISNDCRRRLNGGIAINRSEVFELLQHCRAATSAVLQIDRLAAGCDLPVNGEPIKEH